MAIELKEFRRKFPRVGAFQVTDENLKEVVKFLGGVIVQHDNKDGIQFLTFIHGRPVHLLALPGDWIVREGIWSCVVSSFDFEKEFVSEEKAHEWMKLHDAGYKNRNVQVEGLVIAAMNKQDAATYNGRWSNSMDLVARDIAAQIVKLF